MGSHYEALHSLQSRCSWIFIVLTNHKIRAIILIRYRFKGVFLTEKVEKIKKVLEDIIWLCEERTPLLNEKHITNCVGELCKSIEKT